MYNKEEILKDLDKMFSELYESSYYNDNKEEMCVPWELVESAIIRIKLKIAE